MTKIIWREYFQTDPAKCKSDMKNTILVGNKCELIKQKVISQAEGKELAEEYKIPFFETSAKNGVNVNEPFLCLARTFIQSVQEVNGEKSKDSTKNTKVSLEPSKTPEKTGCCG